ncbi:MAG: UDP-3-O-(3-hydroxymyristoyl)glucosamine N-acyltransferase [Alphaproteobacteria bacterium]|nr:UDP-3-O-(3-hydroxymyristoyl)glucosamine N-acyltransferase [Alphaproteobacteria bacterium]
MADPRFFTRAGPFTAAELAALSGARLADPARADTVAVDVAPLDAAGPQSLSFFDNPKYRDRFEASRAGICIVHPKHAARAPAGMTLLLSAAPYKAYARAAKAFYPPPAATAGIAPSAIVDPRARIGAGTAVAAGAVIGAGASLGQRCRIDANAVIGPGVQIGDDVAIGALASVSHALIGDRVAIYPGVRIGQDGFGFAPDPSGHVKVPQLGRVVIGNDVEIGANTTIDRGSGPDTVIGDGCWIDNLVMIGHNVVIGRGCILVAQTGISGSTTLGDYVVAGGQVGIAGHLTIGAGARLAAGAGVIKDVAPGATVGGYPAIPIRRWHRQTVALEQLVRKKERP